MIKIKFKGFEWYQDILSLRAIKNILVHQLKLFSDTA